MMTAMCLPPTPTPVLIPSYLPISSPLYHPHYFSPLYHSFTSYPHLHPFPSLSFPIYTTCILFFVGSKSMCLCTFFHFPIPQLLGSASEYQMRV